MAQINLLKQQNPYAFSGGTFSIINKILILLIVLGVGFYIWSYFKLKNLNQQIISQQTEIANKKNEFSNTPRSDEVITRQAQLKEHDNLISSHVYWSQLLPEIAKITMKGVSYLSLQTDSKNTLSLSLEVPNMLELDKFLQTLNSPLINKYFRDVKLGSISREQKDASEFLKVDVILSFNPTIIQYKPADNQAVK
jgi:hypothetical protein